MRIGRWFAASLILCPIAPVAAQSTPAAPAAGAKGPAPRSQTGPDIVVQGVVDSPSAWRRAESAHVIVTSKGSEAELKRVTNNLERLYAVMTRLFRRPDVPDETVKLQVTLVDSADFFRSMGLRNLRSEEGPYAATFAGQRYYDPREDGEVLAVARTDQVIKLATALAEDKDLADAAEAGGDGESTGGASFMTTAARPPIARAWEAVLYSAFAQHFLLTYLPAAYPRWYLDGVGALFSTTNVRRDGKIDYAEIPLNFRQVLRSYGPLRVAQILTGDYLTAAPAAVHWTPYHAWLLTHFFLFSKLTPERSQQFQQYMTAIRQGTPMAEAAKVFGNLQRLQDQVDIYLEHGTDYARADASPVPGGDPSINPLTRSSAAVIEARIELGSHLAPDASATAPWVAQLRDTVAGLPYNPEALLVTAEAECRNNQNDACLATAETVLAKAPDSVRALAWQGIALTHQALAGPPAGRAIGLAAARKIFARAHRIDTDAAMPVIGFFQSFTASSELVPDVGMVAMARIIRTIPAAPGPRLYLGAELLRQGQADVARQILNPVLYGGYDSPEKTAAQALFSTAPAARATP